MHRYQQIQNISIQHGLATLPSSKTVKPGNPVDLALILHTLNSAYQETGNHQYAEAANELSRLIGVVQGAHGEFLASETDDVHANEVQWRIDNVRASTQTEALSVSQSGETAPAPAPDDRTRLTTLLAKARSLEGSEELQEYPRCDWKEEIGDGNTNLGYKDWAISRIEFDLEDLQ